MRNFHTHYDNLKVPFHATPEAIQQAYRRLSMRHHPDRNPGNEHANSIMAIINQSYRVLSNPSLRAEHDRWIRQRGRNDSTPPRPSRPAEPPPAYQGQPFRQAYTHISGFMTANRAALVWSLLILLNFHILATIPNIPPSTTPARTWFAPLSQNASVPPAEQTLWQVPRDIAGTYRLTKSEFSSHDNSPLTYLKGKLVIEKMSDSAYLFLDAKTVQGAGSFGYGHVYHVRPPQPGDSQSLYLANNRVKAWAATNGQQLEIHIRGLNFDEVSHWERVVGTYSERYLDRAIMQAVENYKLRQQLVQPVL